jgi:dihydrofolate reductase
MTTDKHLRTFYVIVAVDESGGIGKGGKLPWKLPDEMAYFKTITTAASMFQQNAVIMGRNTWESIPEKFRPLQNRVNIVLTRDPRYEADGAITLGSLNEALWLCAGRTDIEDVFVIGGAQLYEEAVTHPKCTAIFLSVIKGVHDCDAFFPLLERGWYRVAFKSEPQWTASVYIRDKNK